MIKKLKKYFILSNISAVISAFSLLSILVLHKIQNEKVYQIVSVIIGLLFWLSVVITILSICKMNIFRKAIIKKQEIPKMHIGLISFMKTPAGKIADSILFISIFILIMLLFKNITSKAVVLPVLSVLYLSFHMHCLYNGKNYSLLKQDIRDSEERKNNE